MAIDLAVSRAVTQIHALEMAVHNPGPWTLYLGGQLTPASREIGEAGVTFTGEFASFEAPRSVEDLMRYEPLILRCAGEDVWVTSMVTLPTVPSRAEVELALPLGVVA